MDYKTQLKNRIPEGILQFCEVCLLDAQRKLLFWKTVAPEDNVVWLVNRREGTEALLVDFLGVVSDQNLAEREARVILVFQDTSVSAPHEPSQILSPDVLQAVSQLLKQDPRLPFSHGTLQTDTSGVEYWRRCRRYLGHDFLFTPAAGAFVTDGRGRYLLQRRTDDGTWGILGGGSEIGESPLETAQREVREESGLEVQMERLLSIATGDDCEGQYPNGDKGKFWGFLFLARIVGGKLLESNEETLELRWFEYDEIVTLENKSRYLEHNYENLNNPSIRILAKTLSTP